MTISISINSTFPQVIARLQQLPKEVGNKAMKRALDRTMVTARKTMGDEIYKEFALKRGDINSKLKITKAKGSALEITASLFSRNPNNRRSLNLVRFVVGNRTRNRKRGQINLRIKRQAGLKQIKGAFLMPSKKGGPMFLARRTGKPRFPIESLQTIDVPQMFNTRRLNVRVVNAIEKHLGVRFEAEARFYLSRIAARGRV